VSVDYEEIAIEAARAGGRVLARHFREGSLRVETKGRHDFVTEVDRRAEAAVLDVLRTRCPDHAVLAEEGFPQAAEAPWRWVVDPLDGTTNFIHGVPTFCVSVALEGPDGLAAAAIHDPVHAETFHAHAEGGARLDGTPIRVREVDDLHVALLATGFPFREVSRLPGYLRTFERFVRTSSGLRRAGSAALDLAFTACGRYDGFWEMGLSRWDIAAGTLLVREAGGIVTDLVGGPDPLPSGDILAAGPGLHGTMLAVTREGRD